jgi:hypothetical protein
MYLINQAQLIKENLLKDFVPLKMKRVKLFAQAKVFIHLEFKLIIII